MSYLEYEKAGPPTPSSVDNVSELFKGVLGAKKVKSTVPHEECWWGAHLPYLGLEPAGGYKPLVCDTWPVRRQTYGYLPSCRTSLPRDRYQIILLGDIGTCVPKVVI